MLFASREIWPSFGNIWEVRSGWGEKPCMAQMASDMLLVELLFFLGNVGVVSTTVHLRVYRVWTDSWSPWRRWGILNLSSARGWNLKLRMFCFGLGVPKVREEGLCPFLCQRLFVYCNIFLGRSSLFPLLKKYPSPALHTSILSQILSTNIII